jgi:ribosome biogenesis GTPase A
MNATNLTERIATALESLAAAADSAGMASIAREIRDERLPAVREGRMSMVVLGEFNHGKSTAINALLGSDVLPTGITPTTSVITHIRRGNGGARAVRESGVEALDVDSLKRLVTQDAPDDLRHVDVDVDSPFLADGLVVVDTPGVNDISKQKVEITYGYVPRADVVVYVLDATQALKRSEITFIETRLIKNSQDRLFFLLGKSDALSEEELGEVEAHVRSKLRDLLGDVPVFPASARRALKGEDAGFTAFKDAVSTYLREQRDAIVREGGVRTGLRLASVIDHSLAIEQGAFALEADELARRVESVRAKLDKSRSMIADNVSLIDERTAEILASSRENVRAFARDFSAALPREIGRASGDDVKRYLPDFIHDTFKDWLEDEGLYLAMKLEKLAEEVIEITNRNMREAMAEVYDELGVRARSLDLEVDTFGYDVGVFALGALGVTFLAFSNLIVGGVLTLAAPVLAFALKGKVEAVIRDKATEQGLLAIDNAATRVEDEFEKIVREFADKLKQFVEDSGDRLYRQIAEALDRVVSEREKHVGDKGALVEDLGAARTQVAEVRASLEALRGELAD